MLDTGWLGNTAFSIARLVLGGSSTHARMARHRDDAQALWGDIGLKILNDRPSVRPGCFDTEGRDLLAHSTGCLDMVANSHRRFRGFWISPHRALATNSSGRVYADGPALGLSIAGPLARGCDDSSVTDPPGMVSSPQVPGNRSVWRNRRLKQAFVHGSVAAPARTDT